ncbi:ALS2 C-terminal-like protein isoform X2 [Octodon degus]|uniref:ALS2 C-terminal-like protein isoform X2 n=1 Tax=Octodon degus TaxID=10160 RepID=A0A6P3FM57_OCTDE|nr:ALS2 C-terminal-like protein isoform X2 [Octodon degus]
MGLASGLALICTYPEVTMCSPEEALLKLEDAFLAKLALINTHILQPLLLVDPEPSEPRGQECLQLLQQLHRSSQQLWQLTKQSLQSLQRRLCQPRTTGLESLVLLGSADRILQVHLEYIESYTSCVVVQVFQQVAKRNREYWQIQSRLLQKHLSGVSFEGPVDALLGQALHQPLAQHLQQCVPLLLRLRGTLGESHPAWELVMNAITLHGNLQSFLGQELDQAAATQALGHSLRNHLKDMLCTPAHRLLQDSQDIPVRATPLQAERVLLFDDTLVLLQGPSVHSFDLRLVWVHPGQDRCTFCVLTPEEELSLRARDSLGRAVWQRKVSQAVCQALRGKKDFPVLGAGLAPSEPPACRSVAYTFCAEGRLCRATYEGEWRSGKPHGKGTLKWPDGRNHVGNFRWGLEHGFGIYLVPKATEDTFDCYKCHWEEGRMSGYGICEYGSVEVYKGYFQAGLRHGFGVLDSAPQAARPFRYTGHWEKDQRSGYGIQEDSNRGERYIGMWQTDQRHGPGVVVTQAGVCYQGTFQADKMVGPGILLSEDDSLYEGTFSRDLTPEGKGKITFSTGFTLEGSFGSGTGRGLYTQGVLDTAALPPDPSSTRKRQLGVGAFPVESRWLGVYRPFQDFVLAGCPGELQEALLGFHAQSRRELRRDQHYLSCVRNCPEDEAGRMEDILDELLWYREPAALQQYLRKALRSARHPLGKLLRTLMLTFQATYTGLGANKHLQGLAQEEVKQHARELWAAYRGLLQVALQRKGRAPEEESEDTEIRDMQVHGLMLPLVLPSFYSELFTLYLLLHEREDALYSQGITNLSLFPDTKLLEFLDVHKHLWPLKDLQLTSNQRSSLVRDKCFLSAIECLQKIITTVDPREKLGMLEKTCREIEATVSHVLGREHKLPMDDLLPLLLYVVSRARIQHLGAEIHLIRDMMDPVHTSGLYDFMLTALESCYEHIWKDMRLRRLPGHWDLRSLC